MTTNTTVRTVDSASSESAPLSQQTYVLLGITVLITQLPLLVHLPLALTLPGMLLALVHLIPTLRNRVNFSPALMTPLVLLSALGVVLYYGNFFSRDPCVVFLFLLVDFKFIETRKTNDASLIIVLCAFLLLTQFFYWQTIAAAIMAIPSMFMIGLSLFSLQRGANSMSLRDMTHVTAKLFLQAMPIAAILFVAVPRLPTTGNGPGGESSAVTGLSSSMVPGSVSSLTQSNAVAFRVDFKGSAPSKVERYWRGPVLSGFDGVEWYINKNTNHHYELPGSLSAESPMNEQSSYTVTMEPTTNPWLLALDTPNSLPVSISGGQKKIIGHINHERQINTTTLHNGAYRYQMSSLLTDRFKPASEPAEHTLYTADTNPATRKLAREFRERYSDDQRLVNEILLWFNREPFHYTLQTQKLGNNGIDEFLFSTRRGFCEHYAGSFVFMLRAAGIPARVVTGYQGGEMNGDYMIVRQADAHAWAEAYINGQWTRYDPTAAVSIERVESGFNAALGNEIEGVQHWLSQLPIMKAATLKWDAMNYKWQNWVIDFDSRTQQSIWKSVGMQKPSGWHIALILVLVCAVWTLIIVLPGSMLLRRKSDPCERQWSRLQRKFASQGISQGAHETTTGYIDRLTQRWPQHASLLQKILHAYQQGRFSSSAREDATKRHFANEMGALLRKLKKAR